MTVIFRKIDKPPLNILIARTDRIGDFILTLPVFETLKYFFAIHITVLCRNLVAPLLKNNPFVDEILVAEPEEDPPVLAQKIQEKNFSSLLVLVNDPLILKLLPHLKSIPIRIGPLSKPQVFFRYTHPVLQKRSRSIMNEAEYNLEMLKVFGVDPKPIRPQIYFEEEEKQQTLSQLEKEGIRKENLPQTIMVHAGMRGSALNWPLDYYIRLVQKLLEEGYYILLSGFGKEETERNKEILHALTEEFRPNAKSLEGTLNLREYAFLVSLVGHFVGPSTGPTHIANAVETSLTSFYPPIQVQSKTRWEPLFHQGKVYVPEVDCGQKYRCLHEKCPNFFCMEKISPESVFESIRRLETRIK